MLSAGTTAAICQLQALSPVGRCKTFDRSADGYGRGEGVAAIVLRAYQANKAIIGIIRGCAVNQVGLMGGVNMEAYTSRTHIRNTSLPSCHRSFGSYER